jgi:hypothetical protein
MRARALVALVLSGLCLTCQSSNSTLGRPCSVGLCGFSDHKYFSTFYCPPNPPFPGGFMGYSWRDPSRCRQECNSASSSGCDTSGCDCNTDHGSGQWLPCTEANGGVERSDGCFLAGSGVNGETIPCECR